MYVDGLESFGVDGLFELVERGESFEVIDDGVVIREWDDRVGMKMDVDVLVIEDVLDLGWNGLSGWTSLMRLEAISSCRMKSLVLMMTR